MANRQDQKRKARAIRGIDWECVLERVAILELEGGLSQAEAEYEAERNLFGAPDPLVASWLEGEWH